MSIIINGERKLIAPSEPVIFKIDKSLHVLRFNFEVSAKLIETTDGQFDIIIAFNGKQIFEHKFHIDIKYTFDLPDLPAALLIELSGAGIVNGHPTIRLKLSGLLKVIITKSFPILDQEISTAFFSAADIQQIRKASGNGLALADHIKDEDQVTMVALPTSPTFSTTASGLNEGGYSVN